MKIYIYLIIVVSAFIASGRLVKVINIFNPSYSKTYYDKIDTSSGNIGLLGPAIAQQFELGQQIYKDYQKDLELKPTTAMSDTLYLLPQDANLVAGAAAQLFGISSEQLSLDIDKVLVMVRNISAIEEKLISVPEGGALTLKYENVGDLKDNFRILPSSLLLESSNFQCENKATILQRRSNLVPAKVQALQEDVASKLSGVSRKYGSAKLDDLVDLYMRYITSKKLETPLPMEQKSFDLLEILVSTYVFHSYHTNELLQRVNSGYLLHRILYEMKNQNNYKIVSYGVHDSAFISLLSSFKIVTWKEAYKAYTKKEVAKFDKIIYPPPGSNLIIEVHLDDHKSISIRVKYNSKEYNICGGKVGESCTANRISKLFHKLEVESVAAFKEICTSKIKEEEFKEEDESDVEEVKRPIQWGNFIYLIALVVLIYVGYKVSSKVISLMKSHKDPHPKKSKQKYDNLELESKGHVDIEEEPIEDDII